jgi:hypothetical protein
MEERGRDRDDPDGTTDGPIRIYVAVIHRVTVYNSNNK